MSLREDVRDIISQRKSKIGELKDLESEVIQIQKRLQDINAFLSFNENATNANYWSEIIVDKGQLSLWNEVLKGLKTLTEKVNGALDPANNEYGILAQAILRCKRDYLNLAFMGPWRQGKSKVISQLTGLATYKMLLPVAAGNQPCTGTTINVICDTYKDSKDMVYEDVGVVYKHSVQSMCDLLNRYFDLLGIPQYKVTTDNQNALLSHCTSIRKFIKGFIPKHEVASFHTTLLDYIEHIEDYVSGLTGEVLPLKNILSDSESQISFGELVSYRNRNGQVSYKVLATAKAEIYTLFKLLGDTILKTRVMDTPGIGESKIGVNEALRDALQKDVDIAIAINKVEGTSSDMAEVSAFHHILKQELKGRTADKFLYYIFNICGSLLETAGKDARKNREVFSYKEIISKKIIDVIDDLGKGVSDGDEIPGIKLSANHIERIDCSSRRKLENASPDHLQFGNEDGLGLYIHQIMEQMTQNIVSVDGDFCEKANSQVSEIKKEWESLLKKIRSIKLPSYSILNTIADKISELHLALNKLGGNIEISEGIRTDMQAFCDEKYGTEVCLLLSDKDDKPIKFDTESFLYDIQPYAQTKFTKSDYDTVDEFVTYATLKRSLLERILDSIFSHIRQDEADTTLQEAKKQICRVFIDKAGFGFVCPSQNFDEKTWLKCFVSFLEADGNYPVMLDIFQKFTTYSIDAKKEMSQTIRDAIEQGTHCDNFGDYTFDTYEHALQSLFWSLFNIEASIKSLIDDGILKNRIRAIEIDVNKTLRPIYRIATDDAQATDSPSKKELRNFFQNHGDEIFQDKSEVAKQALIDKWTALIK